MRISSVFRAKKRRLSGKMGGKKNVLSKMPAGCAGPTPLQTPLQPLHATLRSID